MNPLWDQKRTRRRHYTRYSLYFFALSLGFLSSCLWATADLRAAARSAKAQCRSSPASAECQRRLDAKVNPR